MDGTSILVYLSSEKEPSEPGTLRMAIGRVVLASWKGHAKTRSRIPEVEPGGYFPEC